MRALVEPHLKELIPYVPGKPIEEVEREYVLAVIDRDLFWAERADWPHRNPEFYTGNLDPNVYIARPYAPLAERMRALRAPASLRQ
jgi:hypothetical protein